MCCESQLPRRDTLLDAAEPIAYVGCATGDVTLTFFVTNVTRAVALARVASTPPSDTCQKTFILAGYLTVSIST